MTLRVAIRFCLAAVLAVSITGVAHGDTYTFANSNPNSNAYIVGSAPQFSLWSANTQGIFPDVVPNYATYTTTVTAPETVTFNWGFGAFVTMYDSPPSAGYVLNGVYTPLNTYYNMREYYNSGTNTLNLLAGDTFGFYIYSPPQIAPPKVGVFSVTLDPATATAPEPGTLLLLGTGLLGFAGAARRKLMA